MKCGCEIPDAAKFCPVCGADAFDANLTEDVGGGSHYGTGAGAGTVSGDGGWQEASGRGDNSDELSPTPRRRKAQRNDLLFFSGVGLLILGLIQIVYRAPSLTTGFPLRGGRSNIFGIPWIVYDILPFAVPTGYLLVIAAGLLGICLARQRRAFGLCKGAGVTASIMTALLLTIRIVREYVLYRSLNLYASAEGQNQFARSLYPVFVFAAIGSVLSAGYIFSSARFGRRSAFNAEKAMIATGLIGLAICIGGVLFGRRLSASLPLPAAWAAVAFGSMPVAGIAGLSKHRGKTARFIWGAAQLIIFNLCMLQSIFYTYSSVILGMKHNIWTLQLYWPFALIIVLAGVFAFSTVMSAHYMTGLATGRRRNRPVGQLYKSR